MALSTIEYTGDGVTTSRVINFPNGFLSREDVTLEVDGVPTDFTWVTDGLVTVSPASAVGAAEVFYRTVDKDTLIHDYSDGVPIEEENLDESNLQLLMAIQEIVDGRYFGDTQELVAEAQSILASIEIIAAQVDSDADRAENAVGSLVGTSISSVAVGTGAKTFTTQMNKQFYPGFVLIVSASTPTAYMHGLTSSYSGTTLNVDITNIGALGTYNDWIIVVSGAQGPVGPTGPAGSPGAGSGDVVTNGAVVANHIAVFDGTSGDQLKDGGQIVGTLAGLNSVNNANWSGTPLSIANGGSGQITAALAFAALKQAATESATGVVELATTAEAAAGTDTGRAVTPAGVAAAIAALGGNEVLIYDEFLTSVASLTIPWAADAYRKVTVEIHDLAYTTTGLNPDGMLRLLNSSSAAITSGYLNVIRDGSTTEDGSIVNAFMVTKANSLRPSSALGYSGYFEITNLDRIALMSGTFSPFSGQIIEQYGVCTTAGGYRGLVLTSSNGSALFSTNTRIIVRGYV